MIICSVMTVSSVAQRVGDAVRPRFNSRPVAEITYRRAECEHHGALTEAEPPLVDLSGEHLMVAGAGRPDDPGDVDRLLGRLGRVADRATGEQPHRAGGQDPRLRL